MTMTFDLAWWGWLIALLGAFLIGFSKSGIAGLGILAVAMFTWIFPARASVGIILPLLIVGDLVSLAHYRRSAVWSHLLRLIPWAALGLLAGYFALDKLDAALMGKLIGAVLLVVTALQFWRMRSATAMEDASQRIARNIFLVALVGITAGFFTMVANASGPIMIIYLLALDLPKLEFMGTGAWFYFLFNIVKTPLNVSLGLITWQTLSFGLLLTPVVILGGLAGYQTLKRINQNLFEDLALGLTVVAALRLMFS